MTFSVCCTSTQSVLLLNSNTSKPVHTTQQSAAEQKARELMFVLYKFILFHKTFCRYDNEFQAESPTCYTNQRKSKYIVIVRKRNQINFLFKSAESIHLLFAPCHQTKEEVRWQTVLLNSLAPLQNWCGSYSTNQCVKATSFTSPSTQCTSLPNGLPLTSLWSI